MDNQQVLRISSLGLEETELKILQVAQAIVKDEGINCELIEGHSTNGELVVVDYDTETGQSQLSAIRGSQVKIIITAGKPVQGKNTVTLHKPVRVTTLSDILVQICRQIYEHISKHPQSTNSATAPSTNQNQNTAFHHFLKAKQEKSTLKVTCPNCPDVYINGTDKTIFIKGAHESLETYYLPDNTCITSEPITPEVLLASVQGLTPHALDAELWQAGIECSNGQLLPEQQTNIPVKLKAWPNFSRQGFKPEFFKIAAYMAKQAISIDELSKVTQIPLNIIIDFYNAAFAVDLIEKPSGNQAQGTQQRSMSNSRKTLLAKLANRLRFA